MPEPQSSGGVECHRFDQLNPELNHGTQHTGMCWAAPRFYSLNSLQTPEKAWVGRILQQCCLNEPISCLIPHKSKINTLNIAPIGQDIVYRTVSGSLSAFCDFQSLRSTSDSLLGISTVTSSGYHMLLYNHWIKSVFSSWLYWLLRCICGRLFDAFAVVKQVGDWGVCCGATTLEGDLSLLGWQTS